MALTADVDVREAKGKCQGTSNKVFVHDRCGFGQSLSGPRKRMSSVVPGVRNVESV